MHNDIVPYESGASPPNKVVNTLDTNNKYQIRMKPKLIISFSILNNVNKRTDTGLINRRYAKNRSQEIIIARAT